MAHKVAKFGWGSTAAEVAAGFDLTGKNVIITGGYSGIGKETARVFATRGANVFVVGRDMVKCEEEVNDLKRDTCKQPMRLDLASLASIRGFVEEYNRLNIPLHFLINNAGVMCCPKGKTVDGFETQFGTNHVGHFTLSNLLVPKLLEGAPSRVVTVSSNALYGTGIRWKDIQFEHSSYGKWAAFKYGQSKTANALFSVEFNRRFKAQGITSNAVHPGIIRTNLQRHGLMSLELIKLLPKFIQGGKLGKMSRKSIPQGAATSMYAAIHPDTAEGGKMYADCAEGPVPEYASDPQEALKLWEYTAQLVGL